MYKRASKNIQFKKDRISIKGINIPVEVSPKDEYDVLVKRCKQLQVEQSKSMDTEHRKKLSNEINVIQTRIAVIKLENEDVRKSYLKIDTDIILAVVKDVLSKRQWDEVLAEARMRQILKENRQPCRVKRGKEFWLSQRQDGFSYLEKKNQNIAIDSFLKQLGAI
jgi:hypothetical protein